MSLKVLIAPLRYVQGPNALSQMGDQLQGIGIKRSPGHGWTEGHESLPGGHEQEHGG